MENNCTKKLIEYRRNSNEKIPEKEGWVSWLYDYF